ncbi:MAG: MFS transporter [Chlorobia bacterium]|nr:MFS transporter [Fimbriimonadaceae bacterium]
MRKQEIPILIAVFLDLVGFGMAFPDVQLRAQHLGASGPIIGILLASLFAVQFLVSPRWGALSDRIGRKPIAVFCTVLSAVSMLVYASTDSLWGILASRILGGFAAANVVVAQAYMADITAEKERGAVMGRIGAAISVGLIGGPFIGGQLAQAGGSSLLGYVAASASGLGALMLLFGMKGTPPKEKREPGRAPIIDIRLLRDLPDLRPMFVLAAVAWFALACLEGTFGRLIDYKFAFPLHDLGLSFTKPQGASGAVFGLESLISFAIQGLLYAWIASRVNFRHLLRFGFVMQGIGLILTPFAPGLGLIFLFSSIYSAGGALANPTVNTICSNLVPENRQGELFGLLQAARSIGFLLGPLIGGALFDVSPYAPYILAGGVATVAALLVPRGRAQGPGAITVA